MSKIEVKDLLDAGVHFGHLTRKWNPNMAVCHIAHTRLRREGETREDGAVLATGGFVG